MGTPAPFSVNPYNQISLSLLGQNYSVCKLGPGHDASTLDRISGIYSVTFTDRETSLVCTTGQEPEGATIESGWRALYVNGPIPFGLTGVVAGITSAVASVGLPVFVISTFDSDLLFLKAETLAMAAAALESHGYSVLNASGVAEQAPG